MIASRFGRETGEILARSPMLMRGYLRGPEDFEATHRGTCFVTNDLGSVDEKGLLTLIGRKMLPQLAEKCRRLT